MVCPDSNILTEPQHKRVQQTLHTTTDVELFKAMSCHGTHRELMGPRSSIAVLNCSITVSTGDKHARKNTLRGVRSSLMGLVCSPRLLTDQQQVLLQLPSIASATLWLQTARFEP
jgi:hypothetical protein